MRPTADGVYPDVVRKSDWSSSARRAGAERTTFHAAAIFWNVNVADFVVSSPPIIDKAHQSVRIAQPRSRGPA